MEDLFDILDTKEPEKQSDGGFDFDSNESSLSESTEPAPQQEKPKYENKSKGTKVNLWEDEIEPVEVDKEGLMRFNRMFTVMSHGEVPGETIHLIDQLCRSLHSKGFTFRYDGNAQDKASTAAYNAFKDRNEIYLPWKGFNKGVTAKLNRPSELAYGYASGFNKAFNKLPPTVRAILARNAHVLLGDACNTPVNLCVIYTTDGAEAKKDINYETTGNMSGIIYACEAIGIPVFNLKNEDVKTRIGEFLTSIIKDS